MRCKSLAQLVVGRCSATWRQRFSSTSGAVATANTHTNTENTLHTLIAHQQKPVIGMIHLQALPGSPNFRRTESSNLLDSIIEKAVAEAHCLLEHGVDGLMLENMHDVPFMAAERASGRLPDPITAISMAHVASQLQSAVFATRSGGAARHTRCPIGIQILSCAQHEAMAVAAAIGLDFIRVENFVFGQIGDEGWANSCAGSLLRYRRRLLSEKAKRVLVLTDIKKKHCSHAITDDVSLQEVAEAAAFFESDGLILTGSATGHAPDLDAVRNVFGGGAESSSLQSSSKYNGRSERTLPIFIGSGMTNENIHEYFPHVDCFIVGSHFKRNGHWKNELDSIRIKQFMNRMNALRQQQNNSF